MRLAVREVWLALRRAPLLAALGVTTIALSLFAFGLFGLVALNIRQALLDVESRVEVRGFLSPLATDADVARIVEELGRMPQVAAVGHVTPDSALRRARAELDEFRDVLEDAALPPSLEVRLREGRRGPADAKDVAGRLMTYPQVDDVRYGSEWVDKLSRIRAIAAVAGTGLAAIFAAIAVVIIGATIRMAVLARAKEIEIMRLVGATNGFVRAPYLLDGLLKGTLGGLLAVLLTWSTHAAVSRNLLATEFFSGPQVALGVAAGALIGLLGSLVSVERHLRRVWRDA
jgi:cell division transport system permease protein